MPFKHNVSIIESSAQVSQIELQQPIIIDKKIEIKPAIAEEKVEDKKPITGSKPQPIQEVKSILEEITKKKAKSEPKPKKIVVKQKPFEFGAIRDLKQTSAKRDKIIKPIISEMIIEKGVFTLRKTEIEVR